MATYIIKPWYKKQTKQTTTFAITSTSFSGYISSSSGGSTAYLINNYKAGSKSSKTNSTGASYTLSYPKILFTDLRTNGSLFSRFSTNGTELDQVNDAAITTSSTTKSALTSVTSYYYAGDSNYTYEQNRDMCRMYMSSTGSNYTSVPMRMGAYTYSYNNNLYHISFDPFANVSYMMAYFDIKDPAKLTFIIMDNFTTAKSSKRTSFLTKKLTMYRATLSEA